MAMQIALMHSVSFNAVKIIKDIRKEVYREQAIELASERLEIPTYEVNAWDEAYQEAGILAEVYDEPNIKRLIRNLILEIRYPYL